MNIPTRLYVVRHAVAEDQSADGDDRSRRLTGKGRRRFAKLVRRLVRAGLEIDVVATSPLVRTVETAELLAAGLPTAPRVEVVEALAPGSDWHAVVDGAIFDQQCAATGPGWGKHNKQHDFGCGQRHLAYPRTGARGR